jgi:hypothetical protein
MFHRTINIIENFLEPFSDLWYLKLKFLRNLGRWPSYSHPSSFNEKLLVYKLITKGDMRLPLWTDKIAVKGHVASIIGYEHIIPTLWQGKELPRIDSRNWSFPYIIKATHSSGQQIIVRNAAEQDWGHIERSVKKWLSSTYEHGERSGEWHYKYIPQRILVERFIGENGKIPDDYKFWVFNGQVKMIQYDRDRFGKHSQFLFDRSWSQKSFSYVSKGSGQRPKAPNQLCKMIDIAEKLGANFSFVRVDLYQIQGKIFFGEVTFFPKGGGVPFSPASADFEIGEHWQLPIY